MKLVSLNICGADRMRRFVACYKNTPDKFFRTFGISIDEVNEKLINLAGEMLEEKVQRDKRDVWDYPVSPHKDILAAAIVFDRARKRRSEDRRITKLMLEVVREEKKSSRPEDELVKCKWCGRQFFMKDVDDDVCPTCLTGIASGRLKVIKCDNCGKEVIAKSDKRRFCNSCASLSREQKKRKVKQCQA